MSTFRYRGRDVHGREDKGEVVADDHQKAVRAVMDLGLFPIEVYDTDSGVAARALVKDLSPVPVKESTRKRFNLGIGRFRMAVEFWKEGKK